jgi:lyso-ornithine lipid O-acyltransferase
MRILLKYLGVFFLVLSHLVITAAMCLVPVNARIKRNFAIRTTSLVAHLLLIVLGIRVHAKHRERFHEKHNGRLIISNHVSYVDVLVLASLVPAVFITSVELKNTPVLGILANFGGSLFVERRKATGLKKEIGLIASVLAQGFTVVLFPESTTSNGDQVMQFKNSLFDSAIVSQTDLLPVCLRYTKINCEQLKQHNRDTVFYYGGVTFGQHAPRLLSLKSVDVEVRPLKTITVHAHDTRKNLAAAAHKEISDAYLSQ